MLPIIQETDNHTFSFDQVNILILLEWLDLQALVTL